MAIRSFYFTFLMSIQFIVPSIDLYSDSPEHPTTHFDFNFNANEQNWVGDFADYPVGDETFFELEFGRAVLPNPIPLSNEVLENGLYLSGNNHSDDLFMFVKRQVEGLEPNTFYALTFNVILESNIPPGRIGIGGSPGESVYVKVGGSALEPQKIGIRGYYQMNVDKGNQSTGGEEALVVGNLANVHVDREDPRFEPITYVNSTPLRVKTDPEGRLWLFLGTDSGFEGPTLFYIVSIAVNAEPIP
ncbi:MAG: hypothetical protein ACHQUC_02275 [Chlamydiales bacterium]